MKKLLSITVAMLCKGDGSGLVLIARQLWSEKGDQVRTACCWHESVCDNSFVFYDMESSSKKYESTSRNSKISYQ